MKKLLASSLVLGMTAAASFGQGYFLFTGGPTSSAWDAFTSSSSFARSPGNVYVSFLIGASGTPANGGVATATNSQSSVSWNTITNDPNFHFATTGGTIVSALTTATGIGKGGWSYNAGSTFQVDNTPGASYLVQAVAWQSTVNGSAALTTPTAAAAAGAALGWGNVFSYSPGANSTALINGFTAAGSAQFGVSPVPEPTSFALAGIGAAAMMIFRRKK